MTYITYSLSLESCKKNCLKDAEKIQGNLKKYLKQKATKCTLLHILITKFVIPLYTGTVNKNSAKIRNFFG